MERVSQKFFYDNHLNSCLNLFTISFSLSVKPDVTFLIDDNDVTDLLTGKLNPQKAFFQGKVKIQGNMGLAMKLQELQRLASGRIEEIRSKL